MLVARSIGAAHRDRELEAIGLGERRDMILQEMHA
jgi:hypothetical protein